MKRSLHPELRRHTPRPKRVRVVEGPSEGFLPVTVACRRHDASDSNVPDTSLETSEQQRGVVPLPASSLNIPAARLGVRHQQPVNVPIGACRSLKRLSSSFTSHDSSTHNASRVLLEHPGAASRGTQTGAWQSLESRARPSPAARIQPRRSWLSLGDAGALGCMARFVALVQESRLPGYAHQAVLEVSLAALATSDLHGSACKAIDEINRLRLQADTISGEQVRLLARSPASWPKGCTRNENSRGIKLFGRWVDTNEPSSTRSA